MHVTLAVKGLEEINALEQFRRQLLLVLWLPWDICGSHHFSFSFCVLLSVSCFLPQLINFNWLKQAGSV
jgi:hypothetical protein